MSKQDSEKQKATGPLDRAAVRGWSPLVAQLAQVNDWALDIAARLARDHDEDLEAIASVREFVHGWLQGQRAEVPLTDVLSVIAILLGAIELDLGLERLSVLAPRRTMRETPSALPALLRCPGAAQPQSPPVSIRRFPERRNASSGVTHLAA